MAPLLVLALLIIPLREKIGNYDRESARDVCLGIIPLREKIGNYDAFKKGSFK